MHRTRRPVYTATLKTVNSHGYLPGKEPHTIIPTCGEILEPAPKYDIIPVYHEVYADVMTPIILLRRIARQSKRFFFLESVEGGERWGRYYFLGYDSAVRATCKGGFVTVESNLREIPPRTLASDQPLQVIRETLSQSKSPSLGDQLPFIDGFVRYFTYVMVEYVKPVLHISRRNANDLDLMLSDKVIAYDHLEQKTEIVVNARMGRTADPGPRPREIQYLEYLMKGYGRVCGEIETTTSLINQSSPLEKMTSPDKPVSTCSVSKEAFYHTVEEIKKYILGGDIFQAIISRQLISPYKGSLLGAYRIPRITSPSPCVVYTNIDNDEIISTSPETLIRLKDERLTTFPVAGSRPRGATPEEDEQLEKELLESEKESSKHNTLVGLGRNGIGKIAVFDSAEVTEYKMIYQYPKIMHIYSQVEGNIRSGLDGCSAIEVLLPAGILSGAPKIRACQITEELKQVPRGIYGRVLRCLNFTGNLDTCIAIHMAVKQGGKVTVQVGGGIVMGSVPENEYEESANETRVVMNAIINVGEVNDR